MGKTELVFTKAIGAGKAGESVLVVAERDALRSAITTGDAIKASVTDAWWGGVVDEEVLKPLVREEEPLSDMTFFKQDKYITFSVFTDKLSRNLGHIRGDALTEAVKKGITNNKENARVVVVLKDGKQAVPAAIALSRAFSLYSLKTGKSAPADRTITVTLSVLDATSDALDYNELQILSDNSRLAASLFDTPTNYLHTDSYVTQAQEVAKAVGASIKVIAGAELEKGGFGGLWGVGKASEHLPALAILTYEPPTKAEKTICLCGKGIVYDTGGLSIKGSTNMPGMKGDMGGSAAVLGAFASICRLGAPHRVHALLCLAENSVSAVATRPDDILTMYSGKTVEVNNTDAEGRLVLADGVAYATQHLQPDVVLDIATLTGAQLICTGVAHAGLVCNDAATEASVVSAGIASGDLVFPMLYCPELLMKEFESVVADMKNNVKRRGNAQSSCAGHFIEAHLKEGWEGKWIHVDIAGPSGMGERGTGFGVALLATLVRKYL